MTHTASIWQTPNLRLFFAFRILFNARYYYPVFAILFLDMGLTLSQFAQLNVIWAATIVLTEVPSGAFADLFGRRNLLVFAAICMLLEMLVLLFIPLGNTTLVFAAFAINRVISGLAEAMASGADEALAYDSLQAAGLADRWPDVLAQLMRWQSAAFVFAMLVGALVYDNSWMPETIAIAGWSLELSKDLVIRFPIALTLIHALICLVVTLRMSEPPVAQEQAGDVPASAVWTAKILPAFKHTWAAGIWILQTRFVFMIVLSAMVFDAAIRLVLTLNSEYYRMVGVPEWMLGVMGAGVALMGVFLPRLARWLVDQWSPSTNYLVLGSTIALGLYGMSFLVPGWGILPALLTSSGMFFLGFFVSHYLNREVDSKRRATVLSFKGLACNLSYGLIGIAYAVITAQVRQGLPPDPIGGVEQTVMSRSLLWIALGFVLCFVALSLAGRFKLTRAERVR